MDQKIKDKDICGLFRTKSKRQILHLLRNEVDNTANMLLKLKSFLIQIEPNEENGEMIRAVNREKTKGETPIKKTLKYN